MEKQVLEVEEENLNQKIIQKRLVCLILLCLIRKAAFRLLNKYTFTCLLDSSFLGFENVTLSSYNLCLFFLEFINSLLGSVI